MLKDFIRGHPWSSVSIRGSAWIFWKQQFIMFHWDTLKP
jgi:hypothetical protein